MLAPRRRGAGFAAVLFGVLSVGCNDQPISDGLAPRRAEVYAVLDREGHHGFEVSLESAPPTTEPLDVLFLLDVTASMQNVADAAGKQADEVMRAVRTISTASNFGVAAVADYPVYESTTPWRLYQDLTDDTEAVSAALKGLQPESGGDIAEAYARGLYESQFLSWRSEARRFIILFGDAPAHGGQDASHGPDPGRDGIPGTSDDLDLEAVLSQLTERGIVVLAVVDESGKDLEDVARATFDTIAAGTGGLALTLRDMSELSAEIKGGVRARYVPVPDLEVSDQYSEWVQIERKPAELGDQRFAFDANVSVPPDVPSGVYRVPLSARYSKSAGGAEIASGSLFIRVGWLGLPWRNILVPLLCLFAFYLVFRSVVSGTPVGTATLLYFAAATMRGGALRLLAVLFVLALAGLAWEYAPGTITG